MDDLTTPLGLTPTRKSRRPWLRVAAGSGGAAVLILAGIAWYALRDQGPAGPTAVATINAPPAEETVPVVAEDRTGSIEATLGETEPGPAAETAGAQGLIEVEPDGGLSDLGGEVVIHDPSEPPPIKLASVPDRGLVEESRLGLLPRIGDNGAKPMDAYARPTVTTPGLFRIAIVVGGIGIDEDASAAAIADLPGAVTLAFAPYGKGLPEALAGARATGHEVLLQVPLEPFDYPKNNPGPHTLTTGASPEENIDRLHWLMCRITNYVGIVNYMGGRFTADANALAPVLEEIGGRGLLFLDDGSSARSRTAELAGATTPFVRADVVLDGDLNAAAIDERLNQLRAIARERGYAIATATAFPVTVERIAAFATTAESRGFVLVPITALVQSDRS